MTAETLNLDVRDTITLKLRLRGVRRTLVGMWFLRIACRLMRVENCVIEDEWPTNEANDCNVRGLSGKVFFGPNPSGITADEIRGINPDDLV